MNEAQIQRQCVQWLNLQPHTLAYSVYNGGISNGRGGFRKATAERCVGYPDCVLTCNGKTIFLEFKTLKGRVSDVQKALHKRLAACGGQVYVVRSLDDVIRVYRESFPQTLK